MTYAIYTNAASIYDQCPKCGGTKTRGALACRKCKSDKAPSFARCASCGVRIRAAYTRCRACYDKARLSAKPMCMDCGSPVKQYSRTLFAKRCWPCEIARRRIREWKMCSVEGCQNPHKAKGFCGHHYATLVAGRKRRTYGAGHRGNQTAGLLSQIPCQVCGYSRMKSELHRIDASLGYRSGNMVAVCSRCHDEIERGLTPCPTPLAEPEIRQH